MTPGTGVQAAQLACASAASRYRHRCCQSRAWTTWCGGAGSWTRPSTALGRIWCALYISGRKSLELVLLGPYSVCWRPLFPLHLFGFIGLPLLSESLLAAAFAMLAFSPLYPSVIASEGRPLDQRFTGFEPTGVGTGAGSEFSFLSDQSTQQWTVELNAFTRNLRARSGSR